MVEQADETGGCDLLKIHYLCGNKDNCERDYSRHTLVVICSKFITFAVTKTTESFDEVSRAVL